MAHGNAKVGMRIAVVRQLISRSMRLLVMMLVACGGNNNGLRVRVRVEWMVFHSDFKYINYRLLPANTNFLSLSDKESVIAGAAFPAHVLVRQGEIKILSVLTRLFHSLSR